MKKLRIIICIFSIICFTSCSDKNQKISAEQAGNTNNSVDVQDSETKKEKVWSEEFANHMNKAKEFEENKNWIWALDEYYNALDSWQDSDEAAVAYAAYKELADIIESGKPGRGEFDTFSIYDEWKNLLLEAESYGNKIFPYEISFSSLKTTLLNRETKTADYAVYLETFFSTRYLKTIGVVANGYNKIDKNGWTGMPASFPGEPVSKESLSSEFYYNDYIYHKDAGIQTNAFAIIQTKNYYVETLGFERPRIIPYEGIFIIQNKDGTVLAESEPIIIGSSDMSENDEINGGTPHGIIRFKGVTEDCIRAIEAKQAYVSCKKMSMIYGKIQCIRNNFKYNNKVDIDFYKSNIHYQGSGFLSKAKLYFAINASGKEFNSNYSMNNKQINCIYFNPQEVFSLTSGKTNFVVSWIYTWKDYEAYIVCNELSKIYNLEPVYKVNGSFELCDLWLNSSEITSDDNANGLRIPSIDYVKKFVEGGKDNNIPSVQSQSNTYNYYSIDADFVNDSYMLLYYLK